MRIVFLLLLFVSALTGKTIELEFPGLTHRVQVFFPENYDASRKWPAVFYYHGTHLIPDTRFIEHHTDQRDWIVVGMSYLQRGKFTYTPESLADEVQILHSVRHHLSTKYSLDPRRVYVAGFSKGGWIASLLIQHDPSLAGAAIMGAGYLYDARPGPGPFRKRTPIFLGVGRRDGNYPFTLRAVTKFRALGAPVIMETWHDLAHRSPREGSPALRQWLALERNPGDDDSKMAAAWLESRLTETSEVADPIARWLALRDLEDTPFLRALGKEHKDRVLAARRALESQDPVAAEAELLAKHRKILRREINSPTREIYNQLLLDYLKLSQSAPDTRQGKIAYEDHLRIEKLLKHFDEQDRLKAEAGETLPIEEEEEVEPTFPSDGRRIPVNPLVK